MVSTPHPGPDSRQVITINFFFVFLVTRRRFPLAIAIATSQASKYFSRRRVIVNEKTKLLLLLRKTSASQRRII